MELASRFISICLSIQPSQRPPSDMKSISVSISVGLKGYLAQGHYTFVRPAPRMTPNFRTRSLMRLFILLIFVSLAFQGEEGVQAVNASDFAIAQFRFLGPLLLKHGRYNYIRMSQVVCYCFYKNIFMSMGMYYYSSFFFQCSSGHS